MGACVAGVGALLAQATSNAIPTASIAVTDPRGLCMYSHISLSRREAPDAFKYAYVALKRLCNLDVGLALRVRGAAVRPIKREQTLDRPVPACWVLAQFFLG